MRTAGYGIALVALVGCGSSGAKSAPTTPETSPTTTSVPATTVASSAETAVADVPPAPVPHQLVTVTVVAGEVQGAMPNGEQWDAKKHAKDAGAVDGPIALYIECHPELRHTLGTVGVPIEAAKLAVEADKTPAADPMVLVQIGDRVFRSPVRPRAFSPVWNFSFQFSYGGNRAGVAPDELVRVHVVDYDGPTRFDTIGATVIEARELVGRKLHQLGPFGSVKQLTLEVDTTPMPDTPPEPSVVRIAVPGTVSWTDTGIDLVAGQKITIDAADEVCFNGNKVDWCAGPEGLRIKHKSNLPGFETVRHGRLVGAIGDTRFPIGRAHTFVAASSGRLRLGINDKNTVNNRGSYAVRVLIAPAD